MLLADDSVFYSHVWATLCDRGTGSNWLTAFGELTGVQ